MSNFIFNMSNQQQFSICPSNGRQTVGDGAISTDAMNPDVLAVCHMQGSEDIYYYRRAIAALRFSALRSLEVQRGAFDVPSGKIPPELSRGSLGSVRGWPASYASFASDSDLSTSPSALIYSSKDTHSGLVQLIPSESSRPFSCVDCVAPAASEHITPKEFSGIQLSSPRTIPKNCSPQRMLSQGKTQSIDGLVTPPLTPDSSPFDTHTSLKNKGDFHDAVAFEILARLFPGSTRTASSYAQGVRIYSSGLVIESYKPSIAFAFEGIVLDLPGQSRTLYIDGKGAENVKLKESIVALLELADEHLNCGALVVFFERNSAALRNLLHSFMYAGASVVTSSPFTVDDNLVLVGFEI